MKKTVKKTIKKMDKEDIRDMKKGKYNAREEKAEDMKKKFKKGKK